MPSHSTVSDAPINADARLAFAKVIHKRLGSNSIPGAIDGVCDDLLWKIINMSVHAKRTDSDGFTYDGEFLMGKRHGMGKSTHPDTRWHPHEGYWENDVRCGKGKETNSRGYSYEGDYENDEYNGWGKVIYPGGDTYEGEYKDGYKHGYGERNSPKAVSVGGWARERSYKGYWDSSDPEGKGIKVYSDGQISEGDFVGGLEHGYCKVTYADERIYEGAMRKGYAFGRGKWTHSNGHEEEGMWYVDTLYDDVDNADDLSVLLGYTFLTDDESDTDDGTPGVYAHGL